jgi:hypothetical protein
MLTYLSFFLKIKLTKRNELTFLKNIYQKVELPFVLIGVFFFYIKINRPFLPIFGKKN